MSSAAFSITGNLVDLWEKTVYPAEVQVKDGRIASIRKLGDQATGSVPFILPGFTDSHVHIESSMLIPSEFSRLAVLHGTVATVSDPHEIANVCGIEGVEFMIRNGKKVPFKFNFGAPSCVPATTFETAGAALNATEVEGLLARDEIRYLSEMMNFPGVLSRDPEVMKKIEAAQRFGKPVDGHAPGLTGQPAKEYIAAGISTDHECFTAEEALEKLSHGMKILIREGSAARNFDALAGLLNDHYTMMMFCSDDKHPDSLLLGHINQLCARAVAAGIDVFKVLQAACINPVMHYKLNVGLLRVGDPADFVVAEDLVSFRILQTYIDGQLVAQNGRSLIESVDEVPVNRFNCSGIDAKQLKIAAADYTTVNGSAPVIEALDGQLITNKLMLKVKEEAGWLLPDTANDILKLVVVNRYQPAPVAVCFIRNFGLKKGALASSVAHDSHNIVAVGADDESLAKAINLVIREKGGISAVADNQRVLGLPVAGLMSTADAWDVAQAYTEIDRMAKEELGSTLASPFMTLSFMALLVIPHLKLSDLGLFDGDTFSFVKR
ncbi:MAG TPA: adenine deaminase [Chitinophagaceae bacterium]